MSRPCLHRALLICDAILRGALRRGYRVEYSESQKQARIFIRDHAFAFSVEERSRRHEVIKDPKQLGKLDRFYTPRYRYELTGVLTLRLAECISGVKNNWFDTSRQKVEDRLSEFFCSLAVAAVHADRREAERRAWQAEYRETQRVRAEYEQADEKLNQILERLERAESLRALLSRLEAERIDLSMPIGRHDSWRHWLVDVIEQTDPVLALKAGELQLVGQV